ncbi:MAG: aminotransferase class I/II-fold pyridoxal phosphate-dependent enzyme [Puniceicoccales bacterium]|jgi:LL-diaminopimelate aminotransferase|nr:aminotransferase class I/II-fold pyridoxal phosphate-dependent enzyme [Puniceicoccales bacterium]
MNARTDLANLKKKCQNATKTGGCHGMGYKFASVEERRRQFQKKFPDRSILDFGIGRPQEAPPSGAMDGLVRALARPNCHGYAECGCRDFLETVARYLERNFFLQLEPEEEILPSMGIKNALTYLALEFLRPGDVLLATVPGYPVLPTHAALRGVEVVSLPLLKKNFFLPDFSSVPPAILHRAKLLLLNYPNNPTGALAGADFFQKAVAFAQEHGLIVAHDAAYAGLHGPAAFSILQIPGAKDICLELYSCSKAHNMTGWRIGWVCGGRLPIAAYRRAKECSDSGQFLPIQYGAMAALDDDDFCARSLALLDRRCRAVERLLCGEGGAGFAEQPPHHPFYLYLPAPTAVDEIALATAAEFSDWLLAEEGILTIPWDEVGHYVRFSMTIPLEPDELEQQLAERLARHRFCHGRAGG